MREKCKLAINTTSSLYSGSSCSCTQSKLKGMYKAVVGINKTSGVVLFGHCTCMVGKRFILQPRCCCPVECSNRPVKKLEVVKPRLVKGENQATAHPLSTE